MFEADSGPHRVPLTELSSFGPHGRLFDLRSKNPGRNGTGDRGVISEDLAGYEVTEHAKQSCLVSAAWNVMSGMNSLVVAAEG